MLHVVRLVTRRLDLEVESPKLELNRIGYFNLCSAVLNFVGNKWRSKLIEFSRASSGVCISGVQFCYVIRIN